MQSSVRRCWQKLFRRFGGVQERLLPVLSSLQRSCGFLLLPVQRLGRSPLLLRLRRECDSRCPVQIVPVLLDVRMNLCDNRPHLRWRAGCNPLVQRYFRFLFLDSRDNHTSCLLLASRQAVVLPLRCLRFAARQSGREWCRLLLKQKGRTKTIGTACRAD